jgi:ABC-2 type transport system ATP-binding protein
VRDVTVNNGGRGLRLTVQGDLAAVLQVATQHQAVNLTTREPSLEEVFLRYYEPATVAPAVKG